MTNLIILISFHNITVKVIQTTLFAISKNFSLFTIFGISCYFHHFLKFSSTIRSALINIYCGVKHSIQNTSSVCLVC
ncbi:uncharacterized protein GVI51_B00561 [Nakaseomyces glabratus]|uniref:uncharacterized protein n=1 Tax=Candida glabrata TaxID=5478 RepID=UPI00138B1D11|nr:hypothetical protein J7293_00233 [Nakaseomyces glabratus]KAH7609905.1 hypothetical protein J7294_00233 [Nakaseomyces glabratus]QHS64619.1 uncharacterized protein GVI51_B00561 [Nakaseomyces glabratus]